LIGVIILIILIVTGMVLTINYQASRSTLEEHTKTLQDTTEYSLEQSIVLVDRGLLLFDQSLDYRLRESMNRFFTAYEESGRDPSRIDLMSLRESFGEGYELYIINESGVIEYTTYPPDHLLDFAIYPTFMERLEKIREGQIFVADRIITEIQTRELRKFVYYPTPDYKYILEISYIDDEIRSMRSTLRYVEAVEPILDMNPYLTSVRIFNFLGDEITNTAYNPEEGHIEIINRVLESEESVEIADPASGVIRRYLFMDLSGNDNPEMMNLVAELTYTTGPVQQKLNELLFTHLFIAMLAMLLGGGIAVGITNLITRPIHAIVEDTEAIADGDLDRRIRSSNLPELQSLSTSIQQMVDRLKDVMERLQASEEELKMHNEELEARVEERTDELKSAHMKADFYLDIITHDINNTNHTAQLYLDLLTDEADAAFSPLIEGIRTSLRKSDEIIGNVSTLRHIKDTQLNTSQIPLRPMLMKEAARDERIRLLMEEDDITVTADPLISQAFSNIIDNSLKFGGEDVKITITAKVIGDETEIRFDDTGPGIPDTMKPHIFGRYNRGTERVRGKGLGLFIVQTLVEERYGGSIRISDRIPGDHRQGISFIIRLKRGPSPK
jgi:signal transduction histidine kinase